MKQHIESRKYWYCWSSSCCSVRLHTRKPIIFGLLHHPSSQICWQINMLVLLLLLNHDSTHPNHIFESTLKFALSRVQYMLGFFCIEILKWSLIKKYLSFQNLILIITIIHKLGFKTDGLRKSKFLLWLFFLTPPVQTPPSFDDTFCYSSPSH